MTGRKATRRLAAAVDAGSFLGTLALVLLAIAALFTVDTLLARLEQAEGRSEARHYYEDGVGLLARGLSLEAVDRFQAATTAERTNPVYQRALAAALLSAGKATEAEVVLTERLQREPTDAAACLTMARALVRDGKPREAVSYYHRAIYGQWDADSAASRIQARFELVDLLNRQGNQRALLAELLPLQDEAPADPATRKRLAGLFLEAGSPSRAAEIFQELLRRRSGDAEVYAGLGEAEIEQGECPAALRHLETASRLDPRNGDVGARIALCRQVMALDPTLRQLSPDEQHRRSVALVDLAFGALVACAGPTPPAAVQAAIDSARAALARWAPNVPGATADSNVDLAERLWRTRRTECPKPMQDGERSLSLVLARAAR